MPENDVLFSITLPDGTKTTLNQEQYSQAQDKLFAKFPDAQVARVQSYVANDADQNDSDSYHIQLPDGTNTQLNAQQFASSREKLMERFPDAQIAKVSDMAERYWRPKLDEAQAALEKFNGEHGSVISKYELYQNTIENNTPSQIAWQTEHDQEYRSLIKQRDALREAVVNNPLVKRGRRQAQEQAMAARETYLDLASKAESRAEKHDYKRAAKLQGDAAELFGAPGQYDKTDKNGFAKYMSDYGKGALNTFSDRDFWTRGLTQIARDIDLHGIRKKVEEAEKAKGAPLDERDFDRIITGSEKAQLFSFYNLARAQAERANDLSSAYKAGTSAAESVGFMAEFLLSQGLANVAGKAMSASTNALARWMGQALMSDKALARAVEQGVTTIPEMSRAAKVGTELARPLVQGLWHTGTQLSTLSSMAQMMNQTNDEGELNSVGRGIWLGFADSFVENWSESLGNTMDKGFDLALGGIGKAGERALGGTSFGRMARWALNSDFAGTLKEAGFNGFFGEMLEEWAGNAVRLATGLMDKDEFKQFASIEQQLEMAASFAPMSLFGLGGQVIGGVRHNKEYSRLSQQVKDILLRNNVSQAEIEDLFNTRFDTGADVAAKLAPYAQQVLNSDSNTAKSDYEKILLFAKEAGINSFAEAMTELRNEERRGEMRDVLTAQIGRPFWQDFNSPEAKDADGNPEQIHQVRVVDFADGSRQFIIAGEGEDNRVGGRMNRSYLTVNENGEAHYINDEQIRQGLEDGTITSDREMMLDDYLQERVDASDKDAEARRMQQELQDKLAQVKARISQNPTFDMGTPEAPHMVTVAPGQVSNEGVNVQDSNGVISSLSWKEVGDYIGIPISTKTDAQLEEDAEEARMQAKERKDKYNKIPAGTEISVTMPSAEGDEQVPYKFAKAIYDESEDFVRIYVADENGNIMTDRNGEEVWFPDEMVQGLDELAERSMTSAEATEEVNPEPVAPESAQPAVSRYTNESGKVNQTAFMKNEPEEWAKWNDARRNDGGANSKERLTAAISELDKQINELNKKKASTANPDDADAIEEQMNGLSERHARLSAIFNGYVAAERAAKEAADATKRAEFEAAAAKKKEEERKASAKIQDDLKEDAGFVELAENYANQKKTYGEKDTYNVGGRKFKGRWVVAEATTPKPSHNPLNDFAPTPGYPIGKAGNSNHYDKDKRAQQITREMSDPFDERAVQEPVVVTKHGIVLSGNGRTQARLLAAQQQTDAEYKDYIREHANKWGLTAEQVDEYANPILYFELEEDVEYTAALFDAFNRSTSKQQSATETAAKVAQMTSEELVMRLDRLFREIGDSIDTLYKNPEKVNELLNMLQAAGIFNANERARYVDEYGNLSGAGEDLVESVLFGTIFDTSDDAVRSAMNDKAIRRAVTFAFPTLVRLRNLSGELSLIGELTEAVSLLSAAKAANGGKAENAVIDYMLQGDLWTGETPIVKATVQLLAHVLNDGKYSSLRSVLNQYIERAEAANYGQAVFTEEGAIEVENKERILRDVLAHNKINIETYGNTTGTEQGVPADAALRPASGEQGSSGTGTDTAGAGNPAGVQGEGSSVDLIKLAKEQAKKNRKLQKILKRADKWMKFLGNGAFEIATGIEDVEKIEDDATRQQILAQINAGKIVEGWFANGKAVIYLPNIPDSSTLDRKIMHEVISHKGIRGLFEAKGEGEFGKFCDWVWGNLMNDAARSYFLNYPGVVELKTLQARQRAAADEFLAHCAEEETAVIAQLDEDFWSRLVEALRNFVNDAIGEDVFRPEDDGWFAQLLKDAAKSIQEGTAAQQEETGALFSIKGGASFSRSVEEFNQTRRLAENEHGLVRSGLYDTSVELVPVAIRSFKGKSKNDAIREFSEGKVFPIEDKHPDGYEFSISKGALGKYLDDSAYKKSEEGGASRDLHYSLLDKLVEIIKRSVDVELHPDYPKISNSRVPVTSNENVLIHRLYGAVRSDDGKTYRVKTTIKEFRDKNVKNKPYTYEVTEIELIDDSFDNPKDGTGKNLNQVNNSITLANLLKGVEKSYDSGKKLLDAEYLDAVESSDMDKAQELVNRAATAAGYTSGTDYQGSVAFNGAAPSSNAYFETREERKEAFDNGDFEGDYTLGDFMETGLDNNDLQWRLDNPIPASGRNEATLESIRNLAGVVKGKKNTVKMYRAVPSTITEDSFRNGDWVTPSRQYAEHHIELQDWQGGRIIEQEVPVDDIWWNGDDINEWGYDDGKGYAYQNTPNNRKLLDPVTYDDNGNVIPLSERFNRENADVRFSVASNESSTPIESEHAFTNVKEGNVLFSIKEKDGGRSLVGIHNISARKLAASIKTGGLANPSMAVIDLSFQKHEDYGEISLIAPSSMIDSYTGRNAGTFTGDAWTPTYPGVSKQMSDAAWDKFFGEVRELPYPFDADTRNDWREYLEDDRMGRSLRWWFLRDTGKNPEIIHHSVNLSEAEREVFKSIEGMGREEVLADSDLWSRLADVYRRLGDPKEVEYAQKRSEIKEGKSSRYKAWQEAHNKDIDEYGIWTSPVFDFAGTMQRELQREGSVAEIATYQAADKYIEDNNLSDAFDKWLQDKEKEYGVKSVLFAGWTRDGDRRYIPNTVENASRLMNQEPVQNSYGNGGVSATRSLLLDRMETLSEIRKNRGLLGSFEGYASDTEEYKVATDNWFNVINTLSEMKEIDDNPYINVDIAESRIQEAIQRRDPIAYLNREYGYGLSKDGEFAEALKASLKEIKALPAKYFETKFNRPVYLNEFAAAVVPANTRADVRSELEKAGLPVYEYDASKNGDRRRATLKASEGEGIRFSIAPNAREEMDGIKAAAQADGSFMKAPNGQDTNLSEDQWLLTRTKSFKNYFGDWQNSPEKASKILDENGEPAVVYHGSTWNPEAADPGEAVFQDSYRGTGSGDNGFFGRGFYFTYGPGLQNARRAEAGFYGPNITEAFLNVRNPFMFNETLYKYEDGKDIYGDEKRSVLIVNMVKNFPELVKDYRVITVDADGNESGEITLEEYAKIFEDTYKNKEFVILESESESNRNVVELCADPVHHEETIGGQKVEWDDYGFRMPMYKPGKNEDAQLAYTHYYLTELDDFWREDHRETAFSFPFNMFGELFESEEFTQALKDKGYDGVVQSAEGDEAVAFNANQIKSATGNTGEFSRSNLDIRFSVEDFGPYRIKATDSPAFKEWFKGSKVVNEDGSPMVVYRGASFDPLSQEPGMGVIKPQRFFSPSEDYARRYGPTRAYYLNIQHPFDVRNKKDADILREFLPKGYTFHVGSTGALDWAELSAFDLDELIEAHPEYDGMIFDEGGDPNAEGGVTPCGISFMPFNGGAQVKSAEENNGEYSSNPDVRFSVRQYRNFMQAQREQKVPGRQYPEEHSDIRFSLSRNNRQTILAWLRKRTDLSDAQREGLIKYLDSLDNPKLQLATGKWFSQGVIRLPEDMSKVEQAVSVAGKAKVDPLQYNSPMELLEAHAEFKPTEKRINPDDVTTLHRAAEYKEHGIVIYDVDDTEESRQNMREIINSHFGKEASPWCLLQGDRNGNLTSASAQYWRNYGAYPKQVAFKDGKLLAFSANNSSERRWWDRKDNPHKEIPITGKIPGDIYGRSAEYGINPVTGKLSAPHNIHKGNKTNGTWEEWDDSGEVLRARYHYKDGKREGVQEEFWDNGQLSLREEMHDGLNVGDYTTWHQNGQIWHKYTYGEYGLTGSQLEYNENGTLAYRVQMVNGNKDGMEERWNGQGILISRGEYKLGKKEGLHETWNDRGDVKLSEVNYKNGRRNGLTRVAHWNGVPQTEMSYKDDIPVGEKRTWYESGNIKSRLTYDEDGQMHGVVEYYHDYVGREQIAERLHMEHGDRNGLRERWFDKDRPELRETYVDGKLEGIAEYWGENGVLRSRETYKNGKLNGLSESWFSNGALWTRAEMKDGKTVNVLYPGGDNEESGVRFSIVTDQSEIERLEKEPTITLYRAMEFIDGELYPPMSQKIPNAKEDKGKKMQRREGVRPGMWQKSDEDPAKAYQKEPGGPWYYDLKKVSGSDVNGVLYNPYLHLSASPLNDQFSAASTRPDLVVVECEVPISELSSGYKAEKANDAVGAKDWHSGTVTAQMGGGRQVVLSRWAKIGRIVPDSEVASMVAPKLVEKNIVVPSNVVTPSLRAALEVRGVKFAETKGDNDVRFSMAAPNGKPSNLDRERHEMVRTENFKDYFGDWEKVAAAKALLQMRAIDVSANKSIDKKTAEGIVNTFDDPRNKIDGRVVRFVTGAVGKILGHQGFDYSLIIPELKNLYETAIPLFFEQEVVRDGHKNHTSNFIGYHHYANKIAYNGDDYYVRLTVQEVKTRKKDFVPNQLHSAHVTDVAIYKTDASVTSGIIDPATGRVGIKPDAKLQFFFDSAIAAQESTSKIVDENGEPKIVYHGSNANFNAFERRNGIRWTMGVPYEVSSYGFFFTDNASLAEQFASSRSRNNGGTPSVRSFFIDMKNPADLSELTAESEELFNTIFGFYPATELGFETRDKWWQAVDDDVTEFELDEKLRQLGYDGIIFAEELDTDGNTKERSYFVTQSNQVKSTDNSGDFNPENPDVRFSILQQGTLFDLDGNAIKYEHLGGLPEQEGRTSYVERTYRKRSDFSFMGKDKIETVGDVAFIFKELETSAVENSFIVYVKDGVPTILHTGIGDIGHVGIDESAFAAGLNDFAPDEVYMVHNHPSGRVEASRADISMLEVLQRMAGEVPVRGIIIDTLSGQYGEFSYNSFPSTKVNDSAKENEGYTPLEVKAFDKMVFSPEYRANVNQGITSPEEVAAYLSAHRLGSGPKVGALLLDHARHVVGNLVLNENEVTTANAKELARQMVNAAVHSTASNTVLFGDFGYNKLSIAVLRAELNSLSGQRIGLTDVVRVEGNNTRSLADGTLADRADARFSVRAADDAQCGGISAVIGQENVADFYRDFYRELPEDMRVPIADRAMENGMNVRKATEEYLSEIAARGNDGTGMLRMAGNLLDYYAGDNVSENVTRYILWRGEKGVNEDNLLDVAHDQFMRNNLDVANPQVRFSVSDSVKEADTEAEAVVDQAKERMDEDKKELKDLLTAAKAMGMQKDYDKKTVEAVTNLAKRLLKDQYIDQLSRREVSRLLGIVRTSVGRAPKTVKKNADAIVEIVIDNLLKREKEALKTLTSRTGTKTNATGVEVAGDLDVQGQKTLKAYKEGIKLEVGKIDDSDDMNTLYGRRARLQSRLSSRDDAVRKEAEAEDAGLALAIEYKEGIKALLDEEASLKDELEDAAAALKEGDMSKTNYAQLVRATQDALRENHIEQVESYKDFCAKMQEMLSGSREAKRAYMEREKARIEAIRHLANSDMQGRDASKEKRPTFKDKLANSSIVRFFAAPLATFDQMLRLFGEKNIAGEGYLWNKYMRDWMEAAEKAYIGQRDAKAVLDKKASEVFGREMIWSDIYDMEHKMPKATVKWWDDGGMKEHELTQGQLLYIYMVNKMADGRMKLRKMGIDEATVEAIKNQMDSRFLELADWLQEEYLVDFRNKYNAVHERLFGASMAAIDNYFPLKINKRDLNKNEDIAAPDYESLPSTTTGSIIKRRRNSKALDLLNADAFSVVIEHIDQMEQWAAFAEFNKDVNALLSYKRFRNQVQNMASVYGSGTTLWNNFKDVMRIAGNAYHPQVGRNQLDSAAVNLAKGATSAKISFRVYTALKQFLSMPAFVADANIGYLAADMATPWKAWNWAMENLPVFEKRWKSRMAGDTRLMSTEMDWKFYRSKAYDKLSQMGMSPNAFVDAVTVAIGAHSMYRTRYERYIKEGFSEEQADKKAKQDATVLYNETQQSNENAFVSAAQLDRTVFSTAISVFRNSSMGFQRQVHDAIRNIGKHMKKGYKEQSIEFMTKQLVREGLTEEQAKVAAERRYARSLMHDSVRLATFGFLVEFAWNLGSSVVYLLFGDDDDKKEEMLMEAFRHALIGGSMEGLSAGNVLSDALNMVAKGENLRSYDPTLLPILSDMKSTYSMMSYDPVSGANELVNLAVQAGLGVNPQTITDAVVAVIDACNGDLDTSKEAMLLIMRVLQVPQSQVDQIYIDELGTSAKNAQKMSYKQMAERYADYKIAKGAPLTGWAYTDELREKREKAAKNRFKKMVNERKKK